MGFKLYKLTLATHMLYPE